MMRSLLSGGWVPRAKEPQRHRRVSGGCHVRRAHHANKPGLSLDPAEPGAHGLVGLKALAPLQADDPTMTVFADPAMLRRLIVNLVANSIRVTADGAPVLIRLQPIRDGEAIR